MTQIVIEKPLSEKLQQADMLDFVDASGTVLGSFMSPTAEPIDRSRITQVVIGHDLNEQLRQAHLVKLVDDSGDLLGSFASFMPYPIDPDLIPPMTEDERRRLLSDVGVHTTKQVLEHLRSLE